MLLQCVLETEDEEGDGQSETDSEEARQGEKVRS